MTKNKNLHVGSTFESWLDEQGLREEMTAAAIKEVAAAQLAGEMKKGIAAARMARCWRPAALTDSSLAKLKGRGSKSS